jgi:hypothetical protein
MHASRFHPQGNPFKEVGQKLRFLIRSNSIIPEIPEAWWPIHARQISSLERVGCPYKGVAPLVLQAWEEDSYIRDLPLPTPASRCLVTMLWDYLEPRPFLLLSHMNEIWMVAHKTKTVLLSGQMNIDAYSVRLPSHRFISQLLTCL